MELLDVASTSPTSAPIFHTRKRSRALIQPGEWHLHQTIVDNESDLPLLIKDVDKLDWLRADAYMINHGTPAEIHAWFDLTLVYRDKSACDSAFSNLRRNSTPVFLSMQDILKLVDHNCLQEVFDFSTIGATACCSFAVLEAPKSRRRWILWPREYNDSIKDKDLSFDKTIIYPTAEDIINKTAKFKYAICVDFEQTHHDS